MVSEPNEDTSAMTDYDRFLHTFQGCLRTLSDVYRKGAEKYGDDTWQHVGITYDYEHLMEHSKHILEDEDDGNTHIAHLACRALFMLWKEQHR